MAKRLHCSCCGADFRTWKGYVEQDQDKGYGHCRKCQDLIMEDINEKLDDLRGEIREALNEKNTAKWDTYDLETQRSLAVACIEDGLVTFEFSPAHMKRIGLTSSTHLAKDERHG